MQNYRIGLCVAVLAMVSGCSWNTYTKADGSTGLRSTSSATQAVYYEDGSYSPNTTYNQYRPIRHTLTMPASQAPSERVTWP